MAEFFKLGALCVVVGGGSLLALGLAFAGHPVWAGLALAGMAATAVAVIVAIARDMRRVGGTAG